MYHLMTFLLLFIIVLLPQDGNGELLDRSNGFVEIDSDETLAKFGPLTVLRTVELLQILSGKEGSQQLYELIKTLQADPNSTVGDCVRSYVKSYNYLPNLPPNSSYFVTSRESSSLEPFVVVFVASLSTAIEYAELNINSMYLAEDEYRTDKQWYHLGEAYVISLISAQNSLDLVNVICAKDPVCAQRGAEMKKYRDARNSVYQAFKDVLDATASMYEGDDRSTTVAGTIGATKNAISLLQMSLYDDKVDNCLTTSQLSKGEFQAASSLIGRVLGDSLELNVLFSALTEATQAIAAHNDGPMLHCSPLTSENGTFSRLDTGVDAHSPWDMVTSKCAKGFSLRGSAATTELLICNGKTGLWEPTPTPCALMCSVLVVAHCFSIEGGIDAYREAQGSGTKLSVSCDEGFLVTNSVVNRVEITCVDGLWSPFTPECLPGCATLTDPNADINGQVQGVQLQSPNTQVNIYCHDQYSVNHNFSKDINVTCLNGTWSPFEPGCELGCFDLNILNSVANYSRNVDSGRIADIFCADNYTINGTLNVTTSITCENGHWVPGVPRCLPLCPPILIDQASIVEDCNSIASNPQLSSTRVNLTCIDEFTVNGTASNSSSLLCLDGWWQPGLPWCQKICPPVFVENAIVTGGIGTSNQSQPSTTQLNVLCAVHYTIANSWDTNATVTCGNGTWTPKLPYCSQMCPPLPVTYASLIGGKAPMSDYQISNTTVVITCWSNETFYLHCTEGRWNQTIPVCNGFKHDLAVAVDQRLLQGVHDETMNFVTSLLYQLPVSENFNRIALLSFCDWVNIDKHFAGQNDHQSIVQTVSQMTGQSCANPNFDLLLEKLKTTVFRKAPADPRSCAKFKVLIVTGSGSVLFNTTAATKIAESLMSGNVMIRFVTLYGSRDDNYQQSIANIFGPGSYVDFQTFANLDLTIVSGSSLLDLKSGNPPDQSSGKNCSVAPTTNVDMMGKAFCAQLSHTNGCFTYKPAGAPTSMYHCYCDRGYNCQKCDHLADPCDSEVVTNYCKLPQTCVNCADCGSVPAVRCGCPDGYETDWVAMANNQAELQCTKDIDECADDICKNGGTCVNTPGSFECRCASGYGGQMCDIPFNCEVRDWVNCGTNAFCDHLTDGMGACRCNLGYGGNAYLYCGSDELPKVHATVNNVAAITTFDKLTMPGYQGNCPVTILRKSSRVGFFNVGDFKVVVTPSATCLPNGGVCQRAIAEVNVLVYNHIVQVKASTSPVFYFDGAAQTGLVMKDNIFVHFDSTNYYIEANELLITVTIAVGNPLLSVDVAVGNSSGYHNRIAGMAGNFNFRTADDLQTAAGEATSDVGMVGDSYIAENFGSFNSLSCLPSTFVSSMERTGATQSLYEWAAQTKCKFLSDRNGPFALCYQYLSAAEIYQAYLDCLKNITTYLGDDNNLVDKTTCEGSLATFANRCRQVVQPIDAYAIVVWKWRKETGCILDCPALVPNSMYCSSHPTCHNSCNNSCNAQLCLDDSRVEGCFCYYDDQIRYVLSVDANNKAVCVPLSQCDLTWDHCHIDDDRLVSPKSVQSPSRKDTDEDDGFDDGCDHTQKPLQL